MQNSNLWAVLWKHWKLLCEHKGGWRGMVPVTHPGLWGTWHCSDTWDTLKPSWGHPLHCGCFRGAQHSVEGPQQPESTNTERQECHSLWAPSGQAAAPGAIQAGDKHCHVPQHSPAEPGHQGQVLQPQEVWVWPQSPAPGQAELAAEQQHLQLLLTLDGQVESHSFVRIHSSTTHRKNMPAAFTKWIFKGWRL